MSARMESCVPKVKGPLTVMSTAYVTLPTGMARLAIANQVEAVDASVWSLILSVRETPPVAGPTGKQWPSYELSLGVIHSAAPVSSSGISQTYSKLAMPSGFISTSGWKPLRRHFWSLLNQCYVILM